MEKRAAIVASNGDVWMCDPASGVYRRFRAHLGQVVEVFDGERTRRVGPGLGYARPWLRAEGPLAPLIERALAEAPATADEDAAPHPDEHAAESPDAQRPPDGLLGRLGALFSREPPPRRDVETDWGDTLPWNHRM